MTVDPKGNFAYVTNEVTNEVTNNVWAYSIGSDGALTPVPGSPVAAGNFPISVVVNSTAEFVYVANFNSNSISAYRITSNGSLTPIAGSPFPTSNQPLSLAIMK